MAAVTQPSASVPSPALHPEHLAAPGSEQRWSQLQRLRRTANLPLEPWIAALAQGALPVASDLLAALWARLDGAAVHTLLASAAAADAAPWLAAGQLELPALAARPGAALLWLEPLLQRQAAAQGQQALLWLELLGQLRDPRVADRLRAQLMPLLQGSPGQHPLGAMSRQPEPQAERLLPLLGLQRQPGDGEQLLALALRPGPLARRRAALEGLALGLSSWPQAALASGLEALASDLDPGLAATAIDLLARLPEGRRCLRRLLGRRLDPAVRARLRRRLPATPLVLLVHGRQGGVIPEALHTLAGELARRRGAPVLLQALTAEAPSGDADLWAAARRSQGLSLVPLLLLPGGHVRRDLPAIAASWRLRAAAAAVPLRRLPFLGAWPRWQRALAACLQQESAARSGAAPCWLHHPLEGPLAARFLAQLSAVLGCAAEATPYSATAADLACCGRGPALLLPLTLAPNRLSESLSMGVLPPHAVLPPLLEMPALREVLLAALEDLP